MKSCWQIRTQMRVFLDKAKIKTKLKANVWGGQLNVNGITFSLSRLKI